MKYTRYDMKRRNNSNLFISIVLVSTLVFAFVIGTVIFNLAFKNTGMDDIVPKTSSEAVDVIDENKENKAGRYIVVQHGMFAKNENIEQGKLKLSPFGNPFTIQEEKGTRVLLGIYNEEEGMKVIKTLTDNSIANSKMVFEINTTNDPCNEVINAIISNELDILSKLSDKSTKSITIADFKKWCAELKEVDKNSKNIALLNELKNHVSNLPEELGKEKAAEYYDFIYKTLKNLNNK